VPVDKAGFDAAMAEQRRRARDARKVTVLTAGDEAGYRQLLADHGTTEFTGYAEYESKGTVLAVVEAGDDPEGKHIELFLDRTPFYAEQGGQVGDTGCIETDTGVAAVTDTTFALPGLIRHQAVVTE